MIEPEICHSETWTTSYYIDDDIETLYPYIECKADIYNDGKVIVYFRNTHEWDGFATVKHKVRVAGTFPVSDGSKIYAFKNKEIYVQKQGNINFYPVGSDGKTIDYSFWDDIDVSYYPSDYSYSFKQICFNSWENVYFNTTNKTTFFKESYSNYYYEGSLPELPTSLSDDETDYFTFTPKIDVVRDYTFYIWGHEFEVTQDMLNGSTVPEPQLNEAEQKILELEAKVKTLTEENEKLKSRSVFDINADGTVNVFDLLALKKHLLGF